MLTNIFPDGKESATCNMFNWFGNTANDPAQAPDDELAEMTLQQLKRKATGAKAQRTMAKKALDGALTQMERSPNAVEAQNVKEQWSRLKAWDKRLMAVYTRMLEETAGDSELEDEANSAEEGITMVDIESRPFRARVAEAIAAYGNGEGAARTGVRQAQAQDNQIRYKADPSLKPKELSEDATPDEVHQWQMKMRGYFFTCGIDTLPAIAQATHLRSCIDDKLLHRVRDKVNDELKIFADVGNPGENCWMKAIDDEFEVIHPVFDRRYKLAIMRQEKSETFTAFAKRARDARTQAHMDAGISGDEFLTLIFLMGVSNEELRKKFLEVEQPTVADLERIGRAFDRTVKGVDKSPINTGGSVQRIAPGGNGGQKSANGHASGGGGGAAGAKNGKLPPLIQEALKARPDLNGKCLNCGATGHTKSTCNRKNAITCSKCGNKHDVSVCLRAQIDAIKAKKPAGAVNQIQESKPFMDEEKTAEGPFNSLLSGRVNMIRARPLEPIAEESADEVARYEKHATPPAPELATPITIRDDGTGAAFLRAAKGRLSKSTPAMPL